MGRLPLHHRVADCVHSLRLKLPAAVNFKVSSYTWGARLKGPLEEEQVLDYIIGCGGP